MKFRLVFLMAVALSGLVNIRAAPADTRVGSYSGDLNDDLQDFLAILPVEKIIDIVTDYLENDPLIAEAIDYLESPAFRDIVLEVEAMQETRDVLTFLQESGLDAFGFLNKLHELLGIPSFEVPPRPSKRRVLASSGGIAGLIADIKATLPIEDIKALYYEKLESSVAFSKLVERLSSPQFQEFVDAVLVKEEVRVIIAKLKFHGVDLEAIADLVTTILGLHFPKPDSRSVAREIEAPRSTLEDDLREFVDLLPAKKIRKIVVKHYLFDKEFKSAVAYVRSEEFHKLVRNLHEITEYNDLLDALREVGLDVDVHIDKIHEMIKFPKVASSLGMVGARSIVSFIDELKAVIPHEQVAALYKKKMETSEDFRYLIELVSSEQFQTLTNKLFDDETFRDLLRKLQSRGVDLRAISDFFLAIFGITTPPGIID